eukprot:Skav213407  [mRNA]  locus=scaffold797:737804:739264:- [translate_table: standard]
MQWEDVLKGYDKLSSTELEFKKGLQSMWLEVLPKAGLLSDQLLHGDAFSRLLEFDANSLNVSAILAKARDEEDLNTVSLCVDAMTSGLKPALSKGFAHQMLVQIRTVFAELASLRDRFHFEGMGEPEDSQLLAALLRQAEEAHETARTEILPTLVLQLATNECQLHIPSHKKIARNMSAESFLQVSQRHQHRHNAKSGTRTHQTSQIPGREDIPEVPSMFSKYASQNDIFDDDPRMGLPQWFQKKKAVAKNLMFEQCPKKQVLLEKKTKTSMLDTSVANLFPKAPCPTGQLSPSPSRCCTEPFCIGCSVLAANNTCLQCLSGYVLRQVGSNTECVICDDDELFQDAADRTCYNYEVDNLCVDGAPPGDNRPFNSLRPWVAKFGHMPSSQACENRKQVRIEATFFSNLLCADLYSSSHHLLSLCSVLSLHKLPSLSFLPAAFTTPLRPTAFVRLQLPLEDSFSHLGCSWIQTFFFVQFKPLVNDDNL